MGSNGAGVQDLCLGSAPFEMADAVTFGIFEVRARVTLETLR